MDTVKKVKCIDNKHSSLIKGNIYTVHKEGGGYFWVNTSSGVTGGWRKDRFEVIEDEPQSSKDTQVGGSHYTKCGIQPYEYTLANGLGGLEHTVIKYVTRWKDKGGVEDLKKARHTLDFLIEYTEKQK